MQVKEMAENSMFFLTFFPNIFSYLWHVSLDKSECRIRRKSVMCVSECVCVFVVHMHVCACVCAACMCACVCGVSV